MTAALDFHDREADETAFEPRVEVRPVVLPGLLGEGPLKLPYAALGYEPVELAPGDPFVVIITPSGESPDHLRRAEDTAYQTSKALTAAGMTVFQYQGKRSTMVYCFPVSVDPRLVAAESLKRMWLQLWK